MGDVTIAINEVWLVLAAALVMFMQAGFALVEAGFTSAKNAGNIIMKNVMDFSVGGITYWAFGFALAYGGSSIGGFLAFGDVFFFNDASRASEWFFQVVFAATAATIISGAIAGRAGRHRRERRPARRHLAPARRTPRRPDRSSGAHGRAHRRRTRQHLPARLRTWTPRRDRRPARRGCRTTSRDDGTRRR